MNDQRLDHLRFAIHCLKLQHAAQAERQKAQGAVLDAHAKAAAAALEAGEDPPEPDVLAGLYHQDATDQLAQLDKAISDLSLELRILAKARGVAAMPRDWEPRPPAAEPVPRSTDPLDLGGRVPGPAPKPNRAGRRAAQRQRGLTKKAR